MAHGFSQSESAIKFLQNLTTQPEAAQETIKALEDKVLKLESLGEKVDKLELSIGGNSQHAVSTDASSTSLSNVPVVSGALESKILSMLGSWKEGMEGKWNKMKEDWTTE